MPGVPFGARVRNQPRVVSVQQILGNTAEDVNEVCIPVTPLEAQFPQRQDNRASRQHTAQPGADDVDFDDAFTFEHASFRPARARPQQASQDQLWEASRAAVLNQYLRTQDTREELAVRRISAAVKLWPDHVCRCDGCQQDAQKVLVILQDAVVQVDRSFVSCKCGSPRFCCEKTSG